MTGPGTYLEKPVNPASYVRAIQRTLGLETAPEGEEKGELKEELQKNLRGASAEAMREALEALRRAKMGTPEATAVDDEKEQEP
jgi:hypothetical protein